MKKIISILVVMLICLAPGILGVDVGLGVGIDITVEDFEPIVWLCGDRVVQDDIIEPGRWSDYGDPLIERLNNYAFEGESIVWDIIVFDKSGKEKISDVYATLGQVQGEGNDIEANCQEVEIRDTGDGIRECNARLDEEAITHFDDNTMKSYVCILTVESPDSMQGEYFITVEAEDMNENLGTFAENEFWFLNPEIALSISSPKIQFPEGVRPGSAAYSNTILVENNAEPGSGVLLDMYMAGTDFYDSSHSGAKCPESNVLDLNPGLKGHTGPMYNVDGMPTGIQYYATNGAFTTREWQGNPWWPSDNEGYMQIIYGDRIDQSKEIMGTQTWENTHTIGTTATIIDTYNMLAPGAEMVMTFRLVLPEPCNGNFDSGNIFFWGEAI